MHPAAAGMLSPIPVMVIAAIAFWFGSEQVMSSFGVFSAIYPLALAVAMPIGSVAGLALHQLLVWKGWSSYLACAAVAAVVALAAGLIVFRGEGLRYVSYMAGWGVISGLVFRAIVYVPARTST